MICTLFSIPKSRVPTYLDFIHICTYIHTYYTDRQERMTNMYPYILHMYMYSTYYLNPSLASSRGVAREHGCTTAEFKFTKRKEFKPLPPSHPLRVIDKVKLIWGESADFRFFFKGHVTIHVLYEMRWNVG